MAKPYVIGIDMGGTNTAFGIVDARGNVIASDSIKTGKHSNFDDYVDELYTEVTRVIEANDAVGKINGIGIGAPNGNYYTGMIEGAPNLPWPSPIPLAEKISTKFGIPCVVTNDANAAAIGEMTYGAARGMKDFIMITLGTGVGSGIVVNGQMVYGHDGFAGELGHVIMKRNNGRMCGCGRTGCLEAYCSATGVARTAREFLEIRSDESKLRELNAEDITSKDVFDAAMAGDKLAKEIFDYTGKILGEALADFTAFSAPEAFVIFGGLAKSGFNFEIDPNEGNVILMQKGNDELTKQVNEILAKALAENLYLGWYEEAKALDGVNAAYDENGQLLSTESKE